MVLVSSFALIIVAVVAVIGYLLVFVVDAIAVVFVFVLAVGFAVIIGVGERDNRGNRGSKRGIYNRIINYNTGKTRRLIMN